MLIGKHNTAERVFIIAEIGNNHEGDIGRAREMVHAAAEAGADAVKFQTFRTEHYVGLSNPDRYRMLKDFELSFDAFALLKEEADRANSIFLSTPFDLESARFLARIVPAFKIASGDNTFVPLLRCVAGFALPVLLSCGMLGQQEVLRALAIIREVWSGLRAHPEIATLLCVTSYPAPPEDVNLAAMMPLAQSACAVAGYSDHTLGVEAGVLSVAAGARIVEKHFTLSKHLSSFRDHQLSADPEEFTRMVTRIREAETLLGGADKSLRPSESGLEPLVRRSVALSRALPVGTVLGPDDFTWVRPGGGFEPGSEKNLAGRRLARNCEAFVVLTAEMLEG